jgi:hypothetical protein
MLFNGWDTISYFMYVDEGREEGKKMKGKMKGTTKSTPRV